MRKLRKIEGIETYPQLCVGFVAYYLQSYCEHPFGPIHKQMFGGVRYQRLAIAAPRGSAKSTILGLFYPLFLLLQEPGVLLIIVSASEMLAIDRVRKIKYELEQNGLLTEDFGNQRTKKWSDSHIELANGSQCVARGISGQIRGLRGRKTTVVICDDTEEDEQVASPERREKFASVMEREVLYIPQTGRDQVVMIGTILHEASYLYEVLTEKRPGWHKLYGQALVNADSDKERSAWPAKWPLTWLKAQRALNPIAFQQEMQNIPITDANRSFKREWVRWISKDSVPEAVHRFLTVDPAIGQTERHDETAIVQVAVDSDRAMYIEACYTGRWKQPEIIHELFNILTKQHIMEVAIESVAFQRALAYAFQQMCQEERVWPIVTELTTGRVRKEKRIEGLGWVFAGDHIRLVRGGYGLKKLEAQLLNYPHGKFDDCIDALAYILDIVKPHGKSPKEKLDPHTWEGTMAELNAETGYAEPWDDPYML